MSVILSEFKIVLVIAGVLAITLATAKLRQAQDAPIYLPASDPYLFSRVCASACPGSTEAPAGDLAAVDLEPAEPQQQATRPE
ncbi:MAG: hypothetical protein ABSH20_12390 [Tepidisphaeraceae bacterium]|jgi:hypothetical protein